MTHGNAEGVTVAPWEPQDPRTAGRRRREERVPVDLGEPDIEIIPTLHFSTGTGSWHLTLECHFPGEGGHLSEGFALSAAVCDAVGGILRGEQDLWDEGEEGVEEMAAELVNRVREEVAGETGGG